jgi:hypothetical protein
VEELLPELLEDVRAVELVGMKKDEVFIRVGALHEDELTLEVADGSDVGYCFLERGNGGQVFDIVLDFVDDGGIGDTDLLSTPTCAGVSLVAFSPLGHRPRQSRSRSVGECTGP